MCQRVEQWQRRRGVQRWLNKIPTKSDKIPEKKGDNKRTTPVV
jgi:hypothetical protein